ncbi:MAG: hypothetical protein ACLTDR_05330 [Adlercreutzia equolifaciens]
MIAQADLHAMSGRAITRTLAVARTIADLAESQEIESAHIAEAVNFRVRDGIGRKVIDAGEGNEIEGSASSLPWRIRCSRRR